MNETPRIELEKPVSAPVKKAAAIWDQRSHFWPIRRLRAAYHKGRYAKVVKYLKKGKVLDIGCGQPCETMPDQAFLRFLGRPDAVGLDIKPVGGPFQFHQGDILNMPFPDETFDNVVAMEVLEHIEDVPGALKEVSRVLKPGGVFVFSTPDCHWLWEAFWDVWTHAVGRMWHHTHLVSLRLPDWLKLFETDFTLRDHQRHWRFDLIIAGTKPK